MTLSAAEILLLLGAFALLAGFLGGLGGRWWTLRKLRDDVRGLADAVDPLLPKKLGAVSYEIEQLSVRLEAHKAVVDSVRGSLAQVVKREKLSGDDIAFLTAAVLDRIKQGALLKAVP